MVNRTKSRTLKQINTAKTPKADIAEFAAHRTAIDLRLYGIEGQGLQVLYRSTSHRFASLLPPLVLHVYIPALGDRVLLRADLSGIPLSKSDEPV